MDWGTLAWHIFWCLLIAFLLGFILGWVLKSLFGKDISGKYEADLNAKNDEIRGLKAKLATASGDASASAKFKTDLSACNDENAGLKARIAKFESDADVNLKNSQAENAQLKSRIASLEGDLATARTASTTTPAIAATLGAIGGSAATGAVTGGAATSGNDVWNNEYGKIKKRLDELEVLATDDEEDTDEELQSWSAETEFLQGKIAALKGGANSDADKSRINELDANAISLLAILRKARSDKAEGIAKVRRQGYGAGVRDDLKEIEGVGPVLEKVLNGLNVWTFKEIAQWDDARTAEVSANLPSFKDRIGREDWIGQSRELHFKHYGERV
jgi:predicted flap endonuclease-1-like 5' DNA nuclease